MTETATTATTETAPTTPQIRTTNTGQYHMTDLRRAVMARRGVCVEQQDRMWIISRWVESTQAWVNTPCHPKSNEHDVLIEALGLDQQH